MRKQSKPLPLTRTEQKAAETDRWVKNHLATARKADDLKNSELRILRLARDAHQPGLLVRTVSTKSATSRFQTLIRHFMIVRDMDKEFQGDVCGHD
jgi:hypothetical protein